VCGLFLKALIPRCLLVDYFTSYNREHMPSTSQDCSRTAYLPHGRLAWQMQMEVHKSAPAASEADAMPWLMDSSFREKRRWASGLLEGCLDAAPAAPVADQVRQTPPLRKRRSWRTLRSPREDSEQQIMVATAHTIDSFPLDYRRTIALCLL